MCDFIILILGLQCFTILHIINSGNNYFSTLYFWKNVISHIIIGFKKKMIYKNFNIELPLFLTYIILTSKILNFYNFYDKLIVI